MAEEPLPEAAGSEEPQFRKLTLDLNDSLAPGILAFLRGLPPRSETAFIRGIIFQWMLDHAHAEDYEQRLLEVLSGPGGRPLFSMHAKTARPRPTSRPVSPHAPRLRALADTHKIHALRHQPMDVTAPRRMLSESPAARAHPIGTVATSTSTDVT